MEKKIIDIIAFQTEAGLDEETAKELYSIFVAEMINYKEDLKQFFVAGNYDELKRRVHDIKGVSSSYRAYSIFESALVLDTKLKNNDLENIGEIFLKLLENMKQTVNQIQLYFDLDSNPNIKQAD